MNNDHFQYNRLLEGNKKFVQETENEDPTFFQRLSQTQHPKIFWIGCADSRVPANQITSTMPGEIFVHRNIANIVVHTDMNCLSCLNYAVSALKVEHVIVCGHYGCGGILASMDRHFHGSIDAWLGHIKDVYRLHQKELEEIEDMESRYRRLVELNVVEQTLNVCKTPVVQKAWQRGQSVHVHGWVYDVSNGRIKDLGAGLSKSEDLDDIFTLKFNFTEEIQ